MALGQAIKEARELRGLSQTQLQEMSGVDAATISIMEKRDSKRSIHAAAIASALRVSLPDLMAGRVAPMLNSGGTFKDAIQDELTLRAAARSEIERALNALTIVGEDKAEIMALIDKATARAVEYQALFMKSLSGNSK